MKHCVNGAIFPVLQFMPRIHKTAIEFNSNNNYCQVCRNIKASMHTYKVQEGDSCAETIMKYG